VSPDLRRAEPTMAPVLLIDDDPDLIPEPVRQAYPGPRYRVEVAGTGADGLARVRAEPPDVILLDLRLPDQPGLDVYQQIRQIDARIPVIFVTLAKGADTAIELDTRSRARRKSPKNIIAHHQPGDAADQLPGAGVSERMK